MEVKGKMMIRDKIVVEHLAEAVEVAVHVAIKLIHAFDRHRASGRKVDGADKGHEVVEDDTMLLRRRRSTPETTQSDDHAYGAHGSPLISLELAMRGTTEPFRGTLDPRRKHGGCDVIPKMRESRLIYDPIF